MDGAGLFSLGEMEESDHEVADVRFVPEQRDDDEGAPDRNGEQRGNTGGEEEAYEPCRKVVVEKFV